MNVTLQLPDDLCTAAQSQAGRESKSLTSWFTDLLRRELRLNEPTPRSLVERLGDVAYPDRDVQHPTTAMLGELYDEALADGELPLEPRSNDRGRPTAFP